jgi:hypothetical protein
VTSLPEKARVLSIESVATLSKKEEWVIFEKKKLFTQILNSKL